MPLSNDLINSKVSPVDYPEHPRAADTPHLEDRAELHLHRVGAPAIKDVVVIPSHDLGRSRDAAKMTTVVYHRGTRQPPLHV